MIKKKTWNKLNTQRTYVNIIKTIYRKPAADIIPNEKKLKVFFSLRFGA